MAKNSYSTRRMERFVAAMEKQGCRVKKTRDGWRLLFPDHTSSMSVHTSTSDQNAVRSMRAQVKRAGLEWPGL